LDAGVRRFGGLPPDDAAANVRAVAEAQAMALFLHSGWSGRRPERLLVTAGGSENRGLLQVLADVFGVEVRTLEVSASAALGAALRAGHAWLNDRRGPVGWAKLCGPFVRSESERIVRPCAEATRRYHGPNGLIEVYAACERFARGLGAEPRAELLAFQRDVSRE
jgi:sugar (pentulose or hexulose) kinase